MNSTSKPSRRSSAKPKFDSLEQEAYLNLWRTYDRLKALEEDLFATHQLSAQQYNTLRLLADVSPGTIPTLALGAKLISRAPDMTRMLDKLEQRKLIERERRAENRRVVEVGITSQGLKLLEKLAEAVKECHRQQLGHMSASSLRLLVDLLKQAGQPHESLDAVWLPERNA
jgi:DNA-binding MarR family transcriptional regulator